MGPYANLEAHEGTANGDVTITFTLPAHEVIITNDASNVDLDVKFKSSETGITLKPTETVTFKNVRLREIRLNGRAVPYRVWGIG